VRVKTTRRGAGEETKAEAADGSIGAIVTRVVFERRSAMRLFGRARGRAGSGSTVFKAERMDETSESMRSRSSCVEMGDLGDGIEGTDDDAVVDTAGRKKGDEFNVWRGLGSEL
jgi:hypothetical protein